MTDEDKIVIRFLKAQLKDLKAEKKDLLKDKYYGWVADAELLIYFCEKNISYLEQ
jgi:hypothetical protein